MGLLGGSFLLFIEKRQEDSNITHSINLNNTHKNSLFSQHCCVVLLLFNVTRLIVACIVALKVTYYLIQSLEFTFIKKVNTTIT